MANRQIGALWKKESKSGVTYLSGVVSMGVFGECPIVVFKTTEKRGESSPDLIIYASAPQRQNGTPPAGAQSESVEADDEVPF
jgi:uncharacterized protein (DUF736 family)